MKDFEKYKQRAQRISAAAERSGGGLGRILAWLMIIAGVVVTGVQTHALAYNGMRGSMLYRDWLDVAAWLPVLLLEGTAVGLILGRLYWFKGTEQRRLGHLASFVVWGALAFNTVAQFTMSNGGGVPDPLLFYVRYILPLSIVAVPYLWKWILDLEPDSQERIATLEVEAAYNSQWREIQRDQNDQVIAAYREGMNSPRVRDAVARLTEKAAIENATRIVGLIEAPVEKLADQYDQAAGRPRGITTSNWGPAARGNSRSAVD
ncbi:MAG: hypothetical protein MOB07_06670 [Acidobacteria bacterium]|nr:hypothetical protein [Acidobacteriota bacterium]